MDEISVEDECSPGSSNRHDDEESVDNEDVHPWPYLKELFLCLGSRNDSWRFQCCLCLHRKTELLAFKNSPSNLKKHVQRKHNSHLEKYLSLTATKRKMMKHSDEESTSKQLKLQESVKMAHKSVDQSIINFVVLGSHPFGIVDQPGFRSMIQDLKPNHTVMSRTALRTRLEKITIRMKTNVIKADPEMIAAAILLPKFRTSWTSNEDVLKAGLDYIKIHLDQVPTQRFGNSSPSSDDEDFFGSMKAHIQESTKQLDAYLTSTSTAFDNLKSFPIVCSLSLELNTPLPASAACERLFSTAGLIFSPKRARLHSKNFENQLLLKLNHKYW